MRVVNRLAGVAFGVHFGDQVALVLVPLAASLVFGASPQAIGMLVACQSLAHLFGSLPFGFLVDRLQLRTLVLAATLISMVGFLAVTASVITGTIMGFGAALIFAGLGVVLFTLTALSIVPLCVAPQKLAEANATIEIPRTLVSFAVPLAIGILISQWMVSWVFALAALAAGLAFTFALRLPDFAKTPPSKDGILRRLREGGGFVLKNSFLRAISLCAIFWNLAFTALLVMMIPSLDTYYRVDPGSFGICLAAFGLAAILGTWVARQIGMKIALNSLLLFGPAISTIAVIILYFVPPEGSILMVYFAFALLGFGPSIWLVTQNSVRQFVTPASMLGRVNAVIQTAIYGMRPIGAVMGGAVMGEVVMGEVVVDQAIISVTTPRFALAVVIVLFLLSFLAMALGRLGKVRQLDDLHVSSAP